MIETFYLPSYTPELNPYERLNFDLQARHRRKNRVRSKLKLRNAAEDHMNTIEAAPDRVIAYIHDPRVRNDA